MVLCIMQLLGFYLHEFLPFPLALLQPVCIEHKYITFSHQGFKYHHQCRCTLQYAPRTIRSALSDCFVRLSRRVSDSAH